MAPFAVVTRDGDLFRGAHLVSGGGRAEARGILETKREIKELRERIGTDRTALFSLSQETAELEGVMASASNAIAALNAEHHKQEKATVVYEAQLQHAVEEETRLAQKAEQLARERHQAEEEREALDRRQEEARASIERLDEAQRLADERLTVAQRRLFEAREATEDLSRRAADSGAAHAALVERASALALEVMRLEEAAAELGQRAVALSAEFGPRRGGAARSCGPESTRVSCGSMPTCAIWMRCVRSSSRPMKPWPCCAHAPTAWTRRSRRPAPRSTRSAPSCPSSTSPGRPPRPIGRTWLRPASTPSARRSTRSSSRWSSSNVRDTRCPTPPSSTPRRPTRIAQSPARSRQTLLRWTRRNW